MFLTNKKETEMSKKEKVESKIVWHDQVAAYVGLAFLSAATVKAVLTEVKTSAEVQYVLAILLVFFCLKSILKLTNNK